MVNYSRIGVAVNKKGVALSRTTPLCAWRSLWLAAFSYWSSCRTDCGFWFAWASMAVED